MSSPTPLTLIHVTHEAVDHIGGIGTVLHGLLTSRVYRQSVGRSILVGPLPHADAAVRNPVQRLGPAGVACHYSGPDHHDPLGLGAILKPIEWAFNTPIVFGTSRFNAPGDETNTAEADVLLIDVNHPNRDRLASFKWFLFEHHRVDSQRYEGNWDYEEYTRLAEPAYHALCALLQTPLPGGEGPGVGLTSAAAIPMKSQTVGKRNPAVVIAHEFMGLPTALRCAHDRRRFRTLFHAHECSTARKLAEGHPGADIAFYQAMNRAMKNGESVGEVFGDQSDFARHALVSRAHVLDGIMAVGPETADELRFLSPQMRTSNTKVVYNGLPARRVTLADKKASRARVDHVLQRVLGFTPDYLITHVTRPVPSKGLWRDLKLCHHLVPHLAKQGKSAAYLLLTCGAPIRSSAQVNDMHARYGWPLAHQPGYPDLVGPELELYRHMQTFNASTSPPRKGEAGGGISSAVVDQPTITAILVNQFGFNTERLGSLAPGDLSTADLRRAADVELGMSTYEPYGIAQLEPLHAGAICVTSTVCGCMGLVRRAMDTLGMTDAPNVLAADFVNAEDVADPLALSTAARDAIEDRVCKKLAADLASRLPTNDTQLEALIVTGQKLAALMSWDHVAETDFLPMVCAAAGS